ncbi:MAG: ABC transporter substrate-binding protein [Pegethrix bostrychoides GSE-TBD4-15B]|jgi:multiple sugar transport system substrate-binding protein|uniref:ABC transporter substrate-binding protein n=1 Tax=Pegethrix bostrychoides GSE-TBD4-15B TaxID=2839662 RepID=A0A951U3X3_9CYAN|nr:ABC transporter substrate-binding protein [Pegethrix bostrychoides GSE-TBD4-15B]
MLQNRLVHWFHGSRLLLAGLFGLLLAVLISCNQQVPEASPVSSPLRIYWNRGLYPAEDQALQQVVDAWKQQSQTPVELAFFSSDDILNQTTIALESGNPPDILFAHRADYTLAPRWARDGKLVDLSDVVAAVEEKYSPIALKSAYLYNKTNKKQGYYGVPIEMQAMHVHYWRDILAQVGLKDADIPNDWDGFWNFWRQTQRRVQTSTSYKNIYGLGLPLSTKASDTYFLFEQILEAYNIHPVDQQGKLRLQEPQVRQAVITAMEWLCHFYRDQDAPSDAINWVDPDNNVDFLNRNSLMTVNPSLSIPASQQDDSQMYFQQIATREFPNKPDGTPMNYLISVKQALVFEAGRNHEAAKDFLSYLTQPEQLSAYVQEALGRSVPAMPDALKQPFWRDSTDPHIATAVRQFSQRPNRAFYNVLNPAYSQVQAENVWGEAIHAALVEGQTVDAAVDAAIARIQQIFADWA